MLRRLELLSALLILAVALGSAAASDWRAVTGVAVAAPLAQATATPTSTPTVTPTPTSTPTPFYDLRQFSPRSGEIIRQDGTIASEGDAIGPIRTVVQSVATAAVTPGLTPRVAENSRRTYLYCYNDSATNPAYLQPVATPVLGQGWRLNAAAANALDLSGARGNLYTGPLYAVATAAGVTVACVEGSH